MVHFCKAVNLVTYYFIKDELNQYFLNTLKTFKEMQKESSSAYNEIQIRRTLHFLAKENPAYMQELLQYPTETEDEIYARYYRKDLEKN